MQQQNINGKPVFTLPTRIINPDSAFKEKLLCDGPTFSAGTSCAFSCTFCYVSALFGRSSDVQKVLKAAQGGFQDVVIRREQPLQKFRSQLFGKRGQPLYKLDTRVIYGSPLVDIAASVELADETTLLVTELLEQTGFTIRLLSKSPLIERIAKAVPEKLRSRVIFGLSTGTPDDALAGAIELGTPKPSKRLAALHRLQDAGYRTFGMLCPILPPENPNEFAKSAMAAIRADRCEHVWGEVLNARGASFTQTVEALESAGQSGAAARLKNVTKSQDAWEEYSRTIFSALAKHTPPGKLRFLQYINAESKSWWEGQRKNGALLLGNHA